MCGLLASTTLGTQRATMLLVLKVPTRAVMNVMGWSQVNMTSRYQHVPAEVLTGIADQVGSAEECVWRRIDITLRH